MISSILDGLRQYWFVTVLGAVLIGLSLWMAHVSSENVKLENRIEKLQTSIETAEKDYAIANQKFNEKQEVKTIQAKTVSAKQIAARMIQVDDTLTAYYKSNAPLPTGKKRQAYMNNVQKAKEENTKITGADEADQIKTWQLNPDWTLKLDSVVIYRDTDRIPIVFSMTTKDGKTAGLVNAIYDVNDDMIDDVETHYTTAGINDEVDVGGR